LPGRARATTAAGACEICSAGKYMEKNTAKGTTSTCQECGMGQYILPSAVLPNEHDEEKDCTECPMGRRWTTSTSECSICKEGKYTDMTGKTSCNDCPKNTFLQDPNTQQQLHDNENDCLQCQSLQFTVTTSANRCQRCPAGRWTDESSGDIECMQCTEGQFNAQIGSTQCLNCPSGFFQEEKGHMYCLPCIPGKLQPREGSSECSDCPFGQHQQGIESVACVDCKDGTYSNVVGLVQCYQCIPGQFQNEKGQSSCKDCSYGQYQDVAAGTTCKDCNQGRFSDDIGLVQCLKCSPGTHENQLGSTSCKICARGTYNEVAESKEETCVSCPDGSSNSKDGSTNCVNNPLGSYMQKDGVDFQLCPQGHSCKGAAEPKVECTPGSAAENQGSVKCLTCTPGMYASTFASVMCTSCRYNHFARNPGATACLRCPLGSKTQDGQTGATSCQKCGAGEYGESCSGCAPGMFRAGSDDDTTICKNCPAGYHQDQEAGAACLPCIPGRAQGEDGAKQCHQCPVNEYAPSSNETSCQKCGMGKTTEGQIGASKCQDCIAGRFGELDGGCTECLAGQYRSSNDNVRTCIHCNISTYQPEKGKVLCLNCGQGMWQTKTGQQKCYACARGTYRRQSKSSAMATCSICPLGFQQPKEGQSECNPCIPGSASAELGASDCSTCQENTFANDTAQLTCLSCPAGWVAPTGSASCTTCGQGKHQDPLVTNQCLRCKKNTYAEKDSNTQCFECPVGYTATSEASSRCESCQQGTFGVAGECHECPSGYKRSSKDTDRTKCVACNPGESTTNKTGSKTCEKCSAGQYHPAASAVCVDCATGLYQDGKGAKKCKKCIGGLRPNKNRRDCENPGYTIAEDCDYTTQYLNNSDINPKNHTCAPCPLGGHCEGNVAWNKIEAKFGWWRLEAAVNRTQPPACLGKPEHLNITEPPCAFSKCLFPLACHGAANPGKFTDDVGEDPATHKKVSNLTEECDEENGYANWCTDDKGNKVRCRLCGTCHTSETKRFKRTGGGTRCKECPAQQLNRILLGVGFFVMVVGSAIMVYMEITSETSKDETSDAIKKLLLNFLQMISLASGLPLEWPFEIEVMFDGFNTLSSAGSNLMIPDCELTNMKTSDAFYAKQVAFTFLVPGIIMTCIVSWSIIWCCCARKKLKSTKQRCIKWKTLKDYTILSIVLMLFLCYSMLVRLSFSNLKCPKVDGKWYLMADLQEPCYTGRHIGFVWLLTVPQILLYVIGLPTAATILVWRNKRYLLHKRFFTRYGLLYMGYREGREWWEAVIAVRKIGIVAIGTFGTLMGVVDLQAFVALGIVFISIVLHLTFEPFDKSQRNSRLLHNLEFSALTICWCTFWAGLLYYLGHEKSGSVGNGVKNMTTVVIVGVNFIFTIISLYIFVREYLRDRRKAFVRRASLRNLWQDQARSVSMVNSLKSVSKALTSGVKVAPKISNTGENEDTTVVGIKPLLSSSPDGTRLLTQDEIEARVLARFAAMPHNIGIEDVHELHADSVIKDFQGHEEALNKLHRRRSIQAKRNTQLRLLARSKLKSSKALSKVPAFSQFSDDIISKIVDSMKLLKYEPNSIICKEGDSANTFYIIMSGSCAITSLRHGKRRINTIGEFAFFGESMMQNDPSRQFRNATVAVVPEEEETKTTNPQGRSGAQVLAMDRKQYKALFADIDMSTTNTNIEVIAEQRRTDNRKSLLAGKMFKRMSFKMHGGKKKKKKEEVVEEVAPTKEESKTNRSKLSGQVALMQKLAALRKKRQGGNERSLFSLDY
jgi:hypothetical protein